MCIILNRYSTGRDTIRLVMETTNGTDYLLNTCYPASANTNECDSMTVKVIKTAAYSILLLLALVGNSVVPAVVYRNPELHTSVNYIIASMSISELLMPIFALPERIKQIYVLPDIWQIDGAFGSLLCKLRAFATITSIIVTVLSIVTFSFERFFAVVYPLKRQPLRGKKSCCAIITFTWITAILYSSQSFYTWSLTTKNGTACCLHSWEPAFDNVEATKTETIVFSVCFQLVPFVIITSLYSAIIFSLRRKKTSKNLGSNQRRRIDKENRKVTLMLLMVVIVCLIPSITNTVFAFVMAYVFDGIVDNTCKMVQVSFMLTYLSFTYQAFSPCIYCVFNPRYRKGVRNLLTCKCRGNYRSESEQEMPEASVVNCRFSVK